MDMANMGSRLSIVAMKGHPGSGKTTIAQSLAKSLRWPLLDKDDVRDSTITIQNIVQSSLLNDLSYAVIWRMAETQLKAGMSVIVDCPLSRPHLFQEAAALAARYGGRLLIVECRAEDGEEWRRRLEERGRESPSWHRPSSWEELEKLVEDYGGCCDYETVAGDVNANAIIKKIVVNTTAKLDREAISDLVLNWVTTADQLLPALTFAP